MGYNISITLDKRREKENGKFPIITLSPTGDDVVSIASCPVIATNPASLMYPNVLKVAFKVIDPLEPDPPGVAVTSNVFVS